MKLVANLAVAGLLLAGCGGDADPTPSGRSMGAPADPAARNGDNTPPRIESVRLEPRAPQPGTPVRAHVQAVDPDGDAVRYRYHWEVNGRRVASRGASLMARDVEKGDVIEVIAIANDGHVDSAERRASVRVGNRAPRMVGVQLAPSPTVKLGAEVVAAAEARDPDGDEVEFQYAWWVNDRKLDTRGERLATRGLRRGDRIRVRAIASDGEDESLPADSSEVEIGNAAPEIVSSPMDSSLSDDGVYRYAVEARDSDGDRNLRFALNEAPEGMEIDPMMGEITWRPSAAQAGEHWIEVSVRDSQGGETTQRFPVTVKEVVEDATDVPANPAP